MHFSREVKKNDEVFVTPLQVVVTGSFEDACRRFKTAVQNEGTLVNLKVRQHYEKPSEKKRRKNREAEERRLLLASREALMLSGEWDKRQKRKEQKRKEKIEDRRTQK